jgi:hypothetical protein
VSGTLPEGLEDYLAYAIPSSMGVRRRIPSVRQTTVIWYSKVSQQACRALPGRRTPRVAATRDDKPGFRRFQTFPIIGDAANLIRFSFGFGPQPMSDTLALWTAFFLPDRKGSLSK